MDDGRYASDDEGSDPDGRWAKRGLQRASSPSSSSEEEDEEEEEERGVVRDDAAAAANASSDAVVEMMKRLSKEEELGKFRALRGEYARKAREYHRRAAAGRVPDVGVAFKGSKRGSNLELRLRDCSGPVIASAYMRTVADEHGYFVQFTRAQLVPEIVLQKQNPTKFSVEYAWTRFRGPLGVDVYFAGNDPFASRLGGAAAVAVTSVPATSPSEPSSLAKGQQDISKFFASTSKRRAEALAKKKTAPGRKKHSQFQRDMFYVRVSDAMAVPVNEKIK